MRASTLIHSSLFALTASLSTATASAQSTPSFPGEVFRIGPDVRELAPGDFDGDGDADLAITTDDPGLRIRWSDQGRYDTETVLSTGVETTYDVVAADFDSDGDVDLAAVTLDAVGIGLIFPILPSLLREVAHTAEVAPLFGLMLALYSAMTFLFSPVLGVLSDRYGRRPVLLVSLAGAAIDYLVMAFAPELWMLVVGRAIAGITSANMAVATAYITDISAEEQRARRFGLFHAMFGIGFIIGPVLGGILGDIWLRAPFLLAAVLNGLNFALALFVLPESRKGQPGTKFDFETLNPFRPLGWALTFASLLPLMAPTSNWRRGLCLFKRHEKRTT